MHGGSNFLRLLLWLPADGLYLAEMDRILQSSKYTGFSLSPPIRLKVYWQGWNRAKADLKQEQDKIEKTATSLCWKKVVAKGATLNAAS